MRLNGKTLVTCGLMVIFALAILNVHAQTTYYLNARLDDFTPTQIDITNPVGTKWHELYPTYCLDWGVITDWIDNTDGYLSPSDQVEFDSSGVYYHVDQVLTTIHWTWKEGYPGDPTPTVESASETEYLGDFIDGVDPDPTVSWHQIYPPEEYSRTFKITSHEDDNGDGLINPSEQFDMTYDDGGEIRWAHLDSISTDIVISPKNGGVPEFPFGMELGLALGLAIVIIYVAWKRPPISYKRL